MGHYNSALFIDYDNVRSELDRYDPAVSARFSNKPLLWLEAFERHLPALDGQELTRRIVSRRCYASPQRINNYRRNFVQTGFEVIDCPPLTAHLKNSADIYIVMDVVDYLQRYPHIEEFMILSADADFVPVLNRLRKELKRSVIFTTYNTSSAYRNCADCTVEPDFFAKHLAIETVAPRASAPTPASGDLQTRAPDAAAAGAGGDELNEEVAARIATTIAAAAERRFGRLAFVAAAQALREQVPGDLGAHWAGHRTFTALLERVPLRGLEIDWAAQEIRDPHFRLQLSGWDEADQDHLAELVGDVMQLASKHVPLLRPAEYSRIFDLLSDYYAQEEPGTFAEAMAAVAKSAQEVGIDVDSKDIRAIASGISRQQYRFGEPVDAAYLCALWRLQVFDLCGDPDWMREPEEAERLGRWFRATQETPEAARDDFLARTADDHAPADGADPPA